jgi:histone deacetylase complex regulatory component SIN3
MVWVIISILSVSVVLIISAPLTNSSKNSRLLIVSFFLGFSGLSIFTYNLISYPSYKEFESNTSKRINPKSLSTSSTAPAEEQVEEILLMVDKLAKNLESNPENVDGWRALLLARGFLNQSSQIEKDKTRIREIFSENPSVLKDILDEF